jgi:hypothetical protein
LSLIIEPGLKSTVALKFKEFSGLVKLAVYPDYVPSTAAEIFNRSRLSARMSKVLKMDPEGLTRAIKEIPKGQVISETGLIKLTGYQLKAFAPYQTTTETPQYLKKRPQLTDEEYNFADKNRKHK